MSRRRKRPLPEPAETTIDALSHEGRGVAHVDGKATFIFGALAGEQVRFRYTQRRGRHDEGTVEEVLATHSPHRVAPGCAHFGLCGGCSLQHLQPEAQLVHKQEVLLEQLTHIGKVQPDKVLPALTGPVWGYRRKARLAVKHVPKKGGILVGFRERNAPYVADINTCPVLVPQIGERLLALRELIGGLSIYDKIPQIEVAVSDDRTALVFRHLEALNDDDKVRLQAFGEEHSFDIYLQAGGLDTVTPLWPQAPHAPQPHHACGPLSYAVDDQGTTIQFQPCDFTQVNAEINRSMVARVIDLMALDGDDRVLELFCGLGNFSLPIARQAQFVTSVEGDTGLLDRARGNAQRNGLENIEFIAADLADTALDSAPAFLQKSYDKLLLDPPRTGALPVLERLSYKDIRSIVYVSCNPATLARDIGLLVTQKGFHLKRAGVMDMFPHTSHVESIALLERAA